MVVAAQLQPVLYAVAGTAAFFTLTVEVITVVSVTPMWAMPIATLFATVSEPAGSRT